VREVTVACEPLGYPPSGLRVHVGDDDTRAFFGEPRGDCFPDAGPAAGDDGIPTFEAPHEASPLNQIMPGLLLLFALPLLDSLTTFSVSRVKL
jgi:hypothetical protein